MRFESRRSLVRFPGGNRTAAGECLFRVRVFLHVSVVDTIEILVKTYACVCVYYYLFITCLLTRSGFPKRGDARHVAGQKTKAKPIHF